MSTVATRREKPTDHRARNQVVAQLVGEAELGALTLTILDPLVDSQEGDRLASLSTLERYRLALLESFFESAKRGSLDDVKALAVAHAQAMTAPEGARQPTLDDDEGRWQLVLELLDQEDEEQCDEERDEARGREFVGQALTTVQRLRKGAAAVLAETFLADELLSFLDRLAHIDERYAGMPLDGYHSLHG